ncbi:MAG TPA: ATP-binding protein [Candidatus Binatus sp.]|jgi:signal transduction histidine kinase|nr:ATP-binding protein [Candidatus Binatus sp.]
MRLLEISKCLDLLRRARGTSFVLGLRTKFLLSIVLIIAGLTFATLLIVGHTAEGQVQREIDKDTRNSILTFQNLRAERQLEENRQAELLATLPSVKSLLSEGDNSPDVQDAAEDLWLSGGYELAALANVQGKMVALHTSTPGFSPGVAEEMLGRSKGTSETGGWWYGNGHLYQVAYRPVELGTDTGHKRLGTVIVGREVDSSVASDVGRIAFCQVAFRYGGDLVVSSLQAMDERALATELQNSPRSTDIQIGKEHYRASTVNLTPGLFPPVTFTVLKSYDDAAAFIARLNQALIGLGLFAVLAGAGLVFLISDTFTKPLATLVNGVRALEEGDFTYPVDAGSGDEVAEVTAAFERMRSTLKRNEEQSKRLGDQLRQAQKMEAVGRLAGGVAHDFNNLLTVIKGHSDLLEEKLPASTPLHHSITQVRKATDRATSLTRQLLAFSRMQVLQPKTLDLNSLIADASKMLPVLIGEDIDFKFDPEPSLGLVKADPTQIEQVLMNLAVNARDAMEGRGGKLTVRTRNIVHDGEYAKAHPPTVPGNYVLLEVEDNGQGMDAQTKARIFEPFFTTKELGKGTGLGLSTVYGVVKQSGGYIWVDSELGKGTKFQIFLPKNREALEAARPEQSGRSTRGCGTVLLAEDEEAVRDLASEFLRASGYTVLVAKDGLDALEIAAQRRGSIHVLITDVVMPRMRGTELARKLKHCHPELKIVYMSGYLEHNSQPDGYEPESTFLQKPFTRESLLMKIAEVISSNTETLQPAGTG